MADKQTQIFPEIQNEFEHIRDVLADPQGWKTASTYTVLELSEEEMDQAFGARTLSYLKIKFDG